MDKNHDKGPTLSLQLSGWPKNGLTLGYH